LRIKEIVKLLAQKNTTNCPFALARELNITILYENLGCTMGYFSKNFRFKFIHINQDLSKSEQRFVCAHELGHVVLHPNINTPFLRQHTLFSVSKIEREANIFAVELLLPDELIHEYMECDFYNVAANYGIPQSLSDLKNTEWEVYDYALQNQKTR
jgi:Zn-dependent peptidase ImmA (M78 family)